MKTVTNITTGVLTTSVMLICVAMTQSAENASTIDRDTVKQWSEPYRHWHYYPDHVIPAKPNIKGFEAVHKTDVPTVFQLPGDKKWYMTFIGFDGQGYQSFIAESDDLIHWTNLRLAMGYGPEGTFDYGGVVLGAFLYEDYDIKAPRSLKMKEGKFFSLYGAYPRQGGYELRPGYEGVACSDDGITWQRAKDEPILSVHQKDCGTWEKDCIYQPWLLEHENTYYNFYNAANGHIEQMGLALSKDLLEWKRYAQNPVIPHGPKDSYNQNFSSDGKVFRDGDHWINFFFGVGRGGAHVMTAFSRDLTHWAVDPDPLYQNGGNPSGLDKTYAHKISLVWNPANETYYMFYNAVGNKGRGIGLITSKPLVPFLSQGAAVGKEIPVPIVDAKWIAAPAAAAPAAAASAAATDVAAVAGDEASSVRMPGVHTHGGKQSPVGPTRPLPIFRKSFTLQDAAVSNAQVVICGLGHFELSVNGTKVGDHFLDPPWSDYADTCYTVSFDVADLLKPGENVLGVMLGHGMYHVPGGRYTKFVGSFGAPKLILCLALSQGDKKQVITSDATWKTDAGPITFSCIYGGEDYDARREQPGWDQPGFDDSCWKPVKVVKGPGGTLRPATSPPVKVIRHLEPASITKLKDGRYEIDLGENLSARPVITVKGRAGTAVTVETAERKGKPWQGHSYTYTLNGDTQPESFAPHFTYFGFQYLYVSGAVWGNDTRSANALPELVDIGADFISSCGPRIGRFTCSNALFNDIDAMIDRSVSSNLQHVLTDCPHREKLGWLEVAHLMGPSILLNYDMGAFYRKVCRDTTDSQLENGLVPDIAPEYVRFQGGFFESPEWGSAAVQLPWLIYRWHGDESILREQYSTMARYTDYLARSRNEAGLVKGGLGDWYDWTPEKGHVGPSQLTPPELPATCMLYDNARILHHAATLQGKVAEEYKWKHLMQNVRRDFLAAYYHGQTKAVATGSQCALAMGLYFGLVPQADREGVLDNLVRTVEANQYRPSTGEVSFRYLVMALAQAGRSDVVYRMIDRTDSPGYGCMLKQGLRTLSERWDRPGSSLNHCMFGHIQEWFQTYLLGIRQAPGSIGFQKVLIDPFFPDDLDWAKGSFDSPNGRIDVAWARQGDKVEVTIKAERPDSIVLPRRKDVLWEVP